MRLFIAVDISERGRQLLAKKVELLQENTEQNLKWVDKEKWHFTLKFLGETEEKRLDSLRDIILSAVEEIETFGLKMNHVSAFPDLDYPKVVYSGIGQGTEEMKQIHENLEKELATAGFEKEDRDYTPHLTLARTYDDTDYKQLAHNLKQIIDKHYLNIFTPVREIHLYESNLLPQGPEYKKIYSFSLCNS